MQKGVRLYNYSHIRQYLFIKKWNIFVFLDLEFHIFWWVWMVHKIFQILLHWSVGVLIKLGVPFRLIRCKKSKCESFETFQSHIEPLNYFWQLKNDLKKRSNYTKMKTCSWLFFLFFRLLVFVLHLKIHLQLKTCPSNTGHIFSSTNLY